MASLSHDGGKRFRIEAKFSGKLLKFHLGAISKKSAEEVRWYVEQMQRARNLNLPYDAETQRWIDGLEGTKLHARMIKLGVVKKKPSAKLAIYVDECIEALGTRKESTRLFYGHTRRNLIEYFGADTQLQSVDGGDAEKFKEWLANKKRLAANTVARRCSVAKQWFGRALRLKLIEQNPFADLKGITVRGNGKKQHFVTEEDAQRVLAACPDSQWRLIFGLGRYGGLRCPSEVLALRWCDIREDRLIVHASKTEHHEGKGIRAVPMFPELRPLLEAVRNETGGGTFVITKYRKSNVNLRTQLIKIIERAGLKRWPKLFQNLRSTRQTELVNHGHPLHKVCNWIGNSRAVAQEHYLQELDEDFRNAAAGKTARFSFEDRQESRHFENLQALAANSDCVFVGSFVGI